MKNFDRDERPVPLTEADMTFELRGATFSRRQKVAPEAVAMIEDSAYEPSSLAVLRMMDDGILMYLIPHDRDLWDAVRGKPWQPEDEDAADPWADVRARAESDPVQLHEIKAIGEWLVEVETRLPTKQPSVSTDGPKSTEPSSTDGSSSEEATRAA